jgi:hypothetical protein
VSTRELLRYPLSALASFHYFPQVELWRKWHAGGLKLVGDSGAFSALSGHEIDLGAYEVWCHEVTPYTTWLASLDVIGDAGASWENWQALRSGGLDVIPTVHYGAEARELDRYAEQGVDFVGLGGMVGRKSEVTRLLRWTVAMMRYARDTHPSMRFHGWGVSHPRLLDSLPWWSVDSSGFGQSYRYARLALFNPDTCKTETAAIDGREVYRLGSLLRRHYGVAPEELDRSGPATRQLLVDVASRRAQLMEDRLRRRHAVPPPTYGVRGAEVGTHVHVADASSWNLTAMGTDPPPPRTVHRPATVAAKA